MLSVWTQPELDVDMDAVAARETVTETVRQTVTVTARETARERQCLCGFWFIWRLLVATTNGEGNWQLANALRCCKLAAELQATARCTRHISVAARRSTTSKATSVKGKQGGQGELQSSTF